MQAINYFVAQKYTEALRDIAASPNAKTVLMPLEAASLIGSVAGIAELARGRPPGRAVADGPARRASRRGGGWRWRSCSPPLEMVTITTVLIWSALAALRHRAGALGGAGARRRAADRALRVAVDRLHLRRPRRSSTASAGAGDGAATPQPPRRAARRPRGRRRRLRRAARARSTVDGVPWPARLEAMSPVPAPGDRGPHPRRRRHRGLGRAGLSPRATEPGIRPLRGQRHARGGPA